MADWKKTSLASIKSDLEAGMPSETVLKRAQKNIRQKRQLAAQNVAHAEQCIAAARASISKSRTQIATSEDLLKRADAQKSKDETTFQAAKRELESESHTLKIKHEEAMIELQKKFITKHVTILNRNVGRS